MNNTKNNTVLKQLESDLFTMCHLPRVIIVEIYFILLFAQLAIPTWMNQSKIEKHPSSSKNTIGPSATLWRISKPWNDHALVLDPGHGTKYTNCFIVNYAIPWTNTVHYKKYIFHTSRKGWCFCGVWDMGGETYTLREDFLLPHLLAGARGY